MNIEISTEELRKRKLFVATPMYGGNCHGMYAKAIADLTKLCQAYGVECRLFYLFNESLITRARNYCVDEFLRSDCTHMMFIDSDIGFDPQDVLTLAALMDPEEQKYEIMCGPYPKKTIAWDIWLFFLSVQFYQFLNLQQLNDHCYSLEKFYY